MPGSWLVVLALLSAPPSDRACEVWVFDGDPWPRLEPTAECPSWTIVQPLPDDRDGVWLQPEGWSPWRRCRSCGLLRSRSSLFEAMMEQAAGMLANPVARSPDG